MTLLMSWLLGMAGYAVLVYVDWRIAIGVAFIWISYRMELDQ